MAEISLKLCTPLSVLVHPPQCPSSLLNAETHSGRSQLSNAQYPSPGKLGCPGTTTTDPLAALIVPLVGAEFSEIWG